MGNRKKDRFFVYLPCKPYVKQYLIHNYGCPDMEWPEAVSLSADKFLMQQFRQRLTNSSTRYNSKYTDLVRYSETVPIEIKKDDFYRYGWALSETDVVSFCSIVETRAKAMMCTYLDVHKSIGIPLATAIRKFQQQYNFPEDIWSADTIRREYNRHGSKDDISISDDLFNKINNIVMVKLFRIGTISQQGLKAYENAEV